MELGRWHWGWGSKGSSRHSLGEVKVNASDEQGHYQHGQEDGDGHIGALQCCPRGHSFGHGCVGEWGLNEGAQCLLHLVCPLHPSTQGCPEAPLPSRLRLL